MELEKFKKLYDNKDAVEIKDGWLLFKDMELYNYQDSKSINLETLENALEYKIEDKTIKEIIEAEENDFKMKKSGGRGQSFTEGKTIFSNQGEKGRSGRPKMLPPAYINTLTGGKNKSIEKTAKEFARKMDAGTIEYGVNLDEYGFANTYSQGNENSTYIDMKVKGYSLHNHPTKNAKGKKVAWNNYSKRDLVGDATDRSVKGGIVTSNGDKKVRIWTKNQNFNSKKFVKALDTAKSKTGNYDKAVDEWLRSKKNQREYGFKFKSFKYR